MMQKRSRFWLLALAFLSLLVIFAPQHAYADDADPCPPGNIIDKGYALDNNKVQQEEQIAIYNFNDSFPLAKAANECVEKLMSLFSTLPTLADPLNLFNVAIMAFLNSILNQLCSAAMGVITSAQQALVNLTKICLPLPSFGAITVPHFSAASCSGAITITPLSFSSPSTLSEWEASYTHFRH